MAGGLGTGYVPFAGSSKADGSNPWSAISRGTLDALQKQFITEVIISVGYKSDFIINYFGSEYLGMRIRYALEEKLLGTGGAILKSSDCINDNSFFVLNGDTFFNIDLSNFFLSQKLGADVSLALFKSDDALW